MRLYGLLYINPRDSSCIPHSRATQSSLSLLSDRSHISIKRYSELSTKSSETLLVREPLSLELSPKHRLWARHEEQPREGRTNDPLG